MDEVIAELESDKATFELTAEAAGTLKTIAKEGDTLAIGAVVCTIEKGEGSQKAPEVNHANESVVEPKGSAKVSSKAIEVKVPPVGESIAEVTLSRWLKNDGDYVNMDEEIAELESDKATFELTAESAGILKRVAKEGDTLAIGAVVCSIEASS